MSLILVEVNSTEQKPELTFTKPVVNVGREANGNDVVFEGARYPMVSRRHAEFRSEGGQWRVHDLGSSYGVFVNGQRITGPQVIGVGNQVQFGTDGPTLLVIWLEAVADAPPAARPVSTSPPVSAPPQPQSAPAERRDIVQPLQSPQEESWEMAPMPVGKPIPAATTPQRPSPAPSAVPPAAVPELVRQAATLEFVDAKGRPPVQLKNPVTWIGREHGCDVVIGEGAAVVSRRHAQIRFEEGRWVLEDNKSFNGTLVNEQRISAVTPLYHDDKIRLGLGGPVLRFSAPQSAAPIGPALPGQRSVAPANTGSFSMPAEAKQADSPGSRTIVFDQKAVGSAAANRSSAQPQLLMSLMFGDKTELTIGRGERNDIKLDGLQISNRHARLVRSGGGVLVEDLRSTNGVHVNGQRVTRRALTPHDAVQIGTFRLVVDAAENVLVYDTRSRTRLDVVNVSRQVKDSATGEQLLLLDSISLSIQPNEFVGLLGPSGAGKSMLMEVMNGMRAATGGSVLVNNLDLHANAASLKQSIGYVPQDDIIHRELTVQRSLRYVAKMRLSRDVTKAELNQIVEEVLDVTGLTERRNVRVKNLSGGQRKRVSMAVELITKPSIIFLDEPTSGLDPGAEERIMRLFRQIAESGRTVILTTHAMENVALFDKIVVLMGGKLAFYGKPDEALAYFGASNFKELYAKLEEPVEAALRAQGEANRRQVTERAAEGWKTKFRSSRQFKEYVEKPLAEIGSAQPAVKQKKSRLGLIGSISQWFTLSRRYLEVLLNDKLTLFILLAQAPAIALMTFIVMDPAKPRDFVYFVLALVSMWFGTSVAAREIIRERAVFKRERMVNLGLLPYLASKLFVIGIIVAVQCLLLFVPLKIFDLAGLMSMPGELAGIPQLWAVLLTAAVGIATGLFVSAVVRTSEMATGLVPLILIPQLLFSGLVGVPHGASRVASMAMPAAWSFDTIKRFSTLDTLEPEGANPKGKTKGKGLYGHIEAENERTLEKARQDFESYKRTMESRYQDSPAETPDNVDPAAVTIRKVPDDLSGYVTFLHPWMNEVVNQIVLMLMFGLLSLATLVVLRLKDNR